MGKKYQNKEILEKLYIEDNMTQSEIADKFGCSVSTLSYWFNKHGIKTRGAEYYQKRQPVSHRFDDTTGYEKWRTSINNERCTVMVHHLILISEGHDPHIVFSDEYDTHHKNNHRFDNRPENLELIEKSKHGKIHAKERWSK